MSNLNVGVLNVLITCDCVAKLSLAQIMWSTARSLAKLRHYLGLNRLGLIFAYVIIVVQATDVY